MNKTIIVADHFGYEVVHTYFLFFMVVLQTVADPVPGQKSCEVPRQAPPTQPPLK